MKEHSIPFKPEMVRAVLDGSKTQTRRVVKPEGAHHIFQFRGTTAAAGADEPTGEWGWCGSESVVDKHIRCPYGVPGDRLWVREAFRFPASLDRRSPKVVGDMALDAGYSTPWAPTQYDADGARRGEWRGFETPPTELVPGKYRPPMFMPRWASRITLEVVSVRVERLQDISEADALAEGIERPEAMSADAMKALDVWDGAERECFNALNQPVNQYRRLWNSINGDGAWDANPWVWCVSFKRLP